MKMNNHIPRMMTDKITVKYEPRTLEDFVEDMVSDGRTQHQVKYVAQSTRWKPQAEEAFRMAKKLRRQLGMI
jgi:formylmethanofuran dehydrogenase subunit E-like metal-binding protein